MHRESLHAGSRAADRDLDPHGHQSGSRKFCQDPDDLLAIRTTDEYRYLYRYSYHVPAAAVQLYHTHDTANSYIVGLWAAAAEAGGSGGHK